VGAITLSRFFAFHSIVFPVLAVVLIAGHLLLVLRHGVTPAPADARETVPFYPRQAFKDAIAVFVCFALLFGAALFVKVPLEKMADPTDLSYLPRPEWYFLFLFELLKYFRGAMEPVATAVLPAVAVTALILAPFLDRFRQKLLLRRILTISIVLFAFSAWGALTWNASASTPRSGDSEKARGAAIYNSNHCDSCHSLRGSGGQVGPALDGVAARRDRVWLHKHFQSPQSVSPDSMMPAYRFSDQEESALLEYLADRE
jgi:ubiquinol-cytochrome c reductase cytochrome b subunit